MLFMFSWKSALAESGSWKAVEEERKRMFKQRLNAMGQDSQRGPENDASASQNSSHSVDGSVWSMIYSIRIIGTE